MIDGQHLTMGMNCGGATYIYPRDPAKPDIRAVFDNRVAGGAEIDINIGAVVHPELATGNDDDTVLHPGNMGRAINLAADQQALFDSLDCQAGIRFPVRRGYRHVNDAVTEGGNRRRHRRSGPRRREHNMKAIMVIHRDRGDRRCCKGVGSLPGGFLAASTEFHLRNRRWGNFSPGLELPVWFIQRGGWIVRGLARRRTHRGRGPRRAVARYATSALHGQLSGVRERYSRCIFLCLEAELGPWLHCGACLTELILEGFDGLHKKWSVSVLHWHTGHGLPYLCVDSLIISGDVAGGVLDLVG